MNKIKRKTKITKFPPNLILLKNKLDTSLSIILDFAKSYAEGDRFDSENFEEAKNNLIEEIQKLEEFKWKYNWRDKNI